MVYVIFFPDTVGSICFEILMTYTGKLSKNEVKAPTPIKANSAYTPRQYVVIESGKYADISGREEDSTLSDRRPVVDKDTSVVQDNDHGHVQNPHTTSPRSTRSVSTDHRTHAGILNQTHSYVYMLFPEVDSPEERVLRDEQEPYEEASGAVCTMSHVNGGRDSGDCSATVQRHKQMLQYFELEAMGQDDMALSCGMLTAMSASSPLTAPLHPQRQCPTHVVFSEGGGAEGTRLTESDTTSPPAALVDAAPVSPSFTSSFGVGALGSGAEPEGPACVSKCGRGGQDGQGNTRASADILARGEAVEDLSRADETAETPVTHGVYPACPVGGPSPGGGEGAVTPAEYDADRLSALLRRCYLATGQVWEEPEWLQERREHMRRVACDVTNGVAATVEEAITTEENWASTLSSPVEYLLGVDVLSSEDDDDGTSSTLDTVQLYASKATGSGDGALVSGCVESAEGGRGGRSSAQSTTELVESTIMFSSDEGSSMKARSVCVKAEECVSDVTPPRQTCTTPDRRPRGGDNHSNAESHRKSQLLSRLCRVAKARERELLHTPPRSARPLPSRSLVSPPMRGGDRDEARSRGNPLTAQCSPPRSIESLGTRRSGHRESTIRSNGLERNRRK